MLGRRPLTLLPLLFAACSSDPDLAPRTDGGAETSATDAPVDTPIDTRPPDCGADPRVAYSLNLGILDSTGKNLAKGMKMRSSLCGAGIFGFSDSDGKVTVNLTKGVPQVLRFESKSTMPGIDGELVVDLDEYREGYYLLDSGATGVLPGYDPALGTLWVQVQQLESDACPGLKGVTVSVPSAPGAQVSYLTGYKPNKDGMTSDDGLAIVTKVPVGTGVEVKVARAGCNATTVGRGYTGKYTTEGGALTYVMAWTIK